MKKISIIIVTYNSEDHIYDCLASIHKYNDLNDHLEIIVVDNNSNDCKTVFKKISELYPHIVLINNPINGGYGQGNNLGIEKASAPIIMIMNPDVRLVEPILMDAYDSFQKNGNLAILGMKQWYNEKTPGLSFDVDSLDSNPIFSIFKSKISNKLNWFDSKTMYINGSCFFVRKEYFDLAGKFDESLFLYCEEKDLHRRITSLSPKISVEFNKKMNYLHLVGDRTLSYKSSLNLLESELYYARKFGVSESDCLHKRLRIVQFYLLLQFIKRQKDNSNVLQQLKNEYKRRINNLQ